MITNDVHVVVVDAVASHMLLFIQTTEKRILKVFKVVVKEKCMYIFSLFFGSASFVLDGFL